MYLCNYAVLDVRA